MSIGTFVQTAMHVFVWVQVCILTLVLKNDKSYLIKIAKMSNSENLPSDLIQPQT